MKNRVALLSIQFCISTMILGCGGGGGDSSNQTVSTASFPLQAANKSRVITGAVDNFSISGSCTGTATITNAQAVPAVFEGTSGFAGTQTITLNFTSCNQVSTAGTGTQYYDQNYTILGFNFQGEEYGKIVSNMPQIPTSVKVGDTAVFATINTYTDSTKAVPKGQRLLSYVIESDTANTAIANLITKGYNTSGQLLYTNQTRYRLSSDASLTTISIDLQYSTTSTLHLILSKT